MQAWLNSSLIFLYHIHEYRSQAASFKICLRHRRCKNWQCIAVLIFYQQLKAKWIKAHKHTERQR